MSPNQNRSGETSPETEEFLVFKEFLLNATVEEAKNALAAQIVQKVVKGQTE